MTPTVRPFGARRAEGWRAIGGPAVTEWYYVSGDEQKGPVSAEELRSLARAGSIVNGTLVWKSGLSKWVPAHVVKGMFSEHADQAAPPPVPVSRNGTAAAAVVPPVAPRAAASSSEPHQTRARPLPAVASMEHSRFCRTCGKSIARQAIACTGCGCAPDAGRHFCPACGNQTLENAIVCVECGSALHTRATSTGMGQKGRIAAGLLGIFLGCLGVHNFYLGFARKATFQLLLYGLGVFFGLMMPAFFVFCFVAAVWGLVDGIMIIAGAVNEDARGQPLRG